MIKIGSYNIQKAIGVDARRRPERTLKVIQEMDCDVIALQEADKRFGPRESVLNPDMISHYTDYKAVPLAEGNESIGWHGNAILVRNSVEVLTQSRLELPTLEPRGAVMADLLVNGASLRVAAMHLSLVGTFRKRQISSLMAQLHAHAYDLPTVLLGDLNEWRDTADSLKLFSPHYEVTSPGKSFPAPIPLASLDRIITSSECTIRQSGVHRSSTARIASDHLPVWVELTIDHTAPAGSVPSSDQADRTAEAD
jgi:endonuclease/exonuclease/phosphatase family metal-dependent hydrolase